MTNEGTRFRPAGADLLAIAVDAYITLILPTVPTGQRHEALMIAKALSIASREWSSSPVDADPELDTNRIRAAEIRNGRYDEDDQARALLWKSLEEDVRSRLSIDQGGA